MHLDFEQWEPLVVFLQSISKETYYDPDLIILFVSSWNSSYLIDLAWLERYGMKLMLSEVLTRIWGK